MLATPRIAVVVLLVVPFFLLFTLSARAEEERGRFGLGLRAGPSVVTQRSDAGGTRSDTKGVLGPMVGANFLYDLTRKFSLGLNVEWEIHEIQVSGTNFGEGIVVAILPFAQYRFIDWKGLMPYIAFGLGMNVNSFSESGTLKGASTSIHPENSFALKGSAGLDYFFFKKWALNLDAGWRWNTGNFETRVNGVPVASAAGTFKGSVLSLLIGVRYYF